MIPLRRRHLLLREATRQRHDRAEAAFVAAGLFATLAGYRRFLAHSHRFHATLEPALEAAGVAALVPDWPARRKLPALRADCRALGVEADCPGTAPPGLATPAALLGALYVTEGATLGGALLAREATHLGLDPTNGAAFLDAYGTSRGRRWRDFLDLLETQPLDPEGEAQLVATACAVFDLYLEALAPAEAGYSMPISR